MTDHLHRNARQDNGHLGRASLADIEQEVADILDVTEHVHLVLNLSDQDEILRNPVWQLAEAVKGLAWAVGSLAKHHEDEVVRSSTSRLAAKTSSAARGRSINAAGKAARRTARRALAAEIDALIRRLRETGSDR